MKKLGRQHYCAWRKLYGLLILLYSLNISSSLAQSCLDVDCNSLQDLNLQCDDDIPLPDDQLITVVNSCGIVTINSTDVFTATGSGCVNSSIVLERTYTVVDDLGTTDTSDNDTLACVQLITVIDTEAPTFTSEPQDVTVEFSQDVDTQFDDWLSYNGYAQVFEDCHSYDWMTDPVSPQIQYGCACTGSGTVVFSAVDQCGNTVSSTATFFVEDTTMPEITVQASDQILECNGGDYSAIFQAWLDSNGGAQATDACSVNWRTDPAAPEIISYCGGTTTVPVSFIAYDDCGNEVSTSADFRVVDTQQPTWDFIPEDLTISCNDPVEFGTPQASDLCSDVVITSVDSETSGNYCDGSIVVTRTWTVHDACQMTTNQATQNITILDQQAPALNTVHPLLVGLSNYDTLTFDCGNVPAFAATDFIATDDCGANPQVMMIDPVLSGADCIDGVQQQLLCSWAASDACGNEATFNIIINIVDNDAPVIASTPQDMTINCGDQVTFDEPVASDDCDNNVMRDVVDTEDLTGCTYSYTRTWTFSDACGNMTTASQTIVQIDNESPIFSSAPADEVIGCGVAVVFGEVVTEDACSQVIVTTQDTIVEHSSCITMYTRTWTASDACGHQATIAQTITVSDTVAPEFTFVPADESVSCGDGIAFGDVEVFDACGNITVTMEDTEEQQDSCVTVYTRVWTATDVCGLTASATQVITAVDDEAPIITYTPSDETISCNDTPNFGAIETFDFCSAATIVAIDTTIAVGCTVTHTRTWTVNDACGNITTAIQTITQTDNLPPVFMAFPEDATIACGALPAFGTPQISDDCGGTTVGFVDNETASTCGVTYTRTWTAMDDCGNEISATQTISAMDNMAPAFDFVPYHLGIACYETIQFGEPVVSDDCGEPTVTFVDSTVEGDPFYGFNQTRTWTVTDACGNTATATQMIWVDGDDTPPVFTYVPEPQSFTCGDSIIIDDPIAVDSCSDVTITYSEVDNGGNCVWGIDVTRTWIATDAAGNTTEVSIIYWIVPVNSPMFFEFIPESYTTEACDQAPDFGIPIPVNNCAIGDIMMTHADEVVDGQCASSYAVTRTWTATDDCGGLATCSQTITIEDFEAPVFMVPPTDLEIGCGEPMLGGEPIASDNCNGGATLSYEDVSMILECDKVVIRTWTAMDDCGNMRTAVQTITVVDYVSPEFTFVPQDMTTTCEQGIAFGTPQYTDNCSAVSISFMDTTTPGDCTTGYEVTREWTIMDACGNETRAMQTITVLIPETAIQFSNEPASFSISCGEPVTFGTVSAQTTCSGSVFLNVMDDVANLGCEVVHTRTWMATDNCGNQKMVSQSITVVDNTAPFFSSAPADMTISCEAVVEFGDAAARDRCNAVNITFVDTEETVACQEIYTRTWTAMDACGNEATAAQKITVSSGELTFEFVPEDAVVACDAVYEFATPVLGNHCSEVTLDFQDEEFAGDAAGEYRIVRTWTAMDACGGAVTATQEVEFVDEVAPTFYFVPNEPIRIRIRDWNRRWEPGLFVEDNCSMVTITGPERRRSSVCNGLMLEYTYTATDEAGNSREQTYMVNVIMRPDWHCNDDLVGTPESFNNTENLDLSDFETTNTEESFDNEVTLHPNPAVDKVFVSYYNESNNTDTEIVIYNVVGQEMARQKVISAQGHNSFDLNLVHFSDGNYLVRIKIGDQLSTKKLLIAKE